MEAKMETVLGNFRRHAFEAEYFESGEEAVSWLLTQFRPGMTAGFGGSVTVHGLGIPEKLAAAGVAVYDPETCEPVDEADTLWAARDTDAYFCSANALLEDGGVLNVDGTGNRVGACVYGPKHLYIVAGVNKLCPDLDAAEARIRAAAARNCRALGKKTPCAVTGECSDCLSPDRSCRAYLLLRRPTRRVPVTVVIINEELGY